MTELEYIFADLVLSDIPVNTPFEYYNVQTHTLLNKKDKLDEKTFLQLSELIANRKIDVRKFLLENDYIKCVNESYPKDILTDIVGKKAKELGGHNQYVAWKAKQDRQENWSKIPAKKWLTILVFTNLFTAFVAPYILLLLQEPKSIEGLKLQQQIQALRDSVQRNLYQPKETLNIEKNDSLEKKN